MFNAKLLLVILISYLFGSIPWALVIGKVFYHKDIRNYGSGNLGGTNAGRVLGKKAAITVTVLDALKAFFSMLLASYVCPNGIQFAGLACCIGHCFPIFANFKGGKAVATSYGFMLGIAALITGRYFLNFLFPILCFFIILYFCRMVSVSSISSILVEVITSFVIKNPLAVSISLLILWGFVTYRHHENLARVLKGTENKIKWMGPVK